MHRSCTTFILSLLILSGWVRKQLVLLKVRTGMYRYIQVRTTVKFSYCLIQCCTGTYWYVPVCTDLPDPVQGYRIPDGPLKSLNTDCSAGNSLQPSFWRRISNSTLSGRSDCVAGEAEAKVASRMAPLPLVEQELTWFNRDLFWTGGPLFLVSYRTECFVLPARWNALSFTMKGSLQLRDFWRPPAL